MPVLVENLAKEFGRDHRFRLDFQHLRDMGGPGGSTITNGLSYAEVTALSSELTDLYRRVSGLAPERERAAAAAPIGESASGRRAEDISADEPYICYAAKPNSLLIRANGRVGKCTVALSDERNDIGHLNRDGTVTIDNEKLRPWIRGLATLNADLLSCPLHNLPKAPAKSDSHRILERDSR
jgi:uncharacterized protein